MSDIFCLPPLSAGLKSISPFLRQAEELLSHDRIMAYWCAYYAAHSGLLLNAPDLASRDVLAGLLRVLERLKEEIGDDRAVDIEVDSFAYVERFALGEFAVAETEYREGRVNKATASKYMAAACLLEILNVFPTFNPSEIREEKIRYAKNKAAEISKILRARQSPGCGSSSSSTKCSGSSVPSLPSSVSSPSPSIRSSPHIKKTLPLPRLQLCDIECANLTFSRPHRLGGQDAPRNWSTIATPGTIDRTPYSTDDDESSGPIQDHRSCRSWIGEQSIDAFQSNRSEADGNDAGWHGSSQISSSPASTSSRLSKSSPSSQPTKSSTSTSLSLSSQSSAPSRPRTVSDRRNVDQQVGVELTPLVIAKAQKHARFAISALEHEDAEQSRKELSAALAVLGV